MKFIKTILCAASVIAVSFSAQAQFSGPAGRSADLLNNTPLIVTTGAISNITVYVKPNQNGFALQPYMVLTNSGTPAIAFYANPVVPVPFTSSTGTAIGTPALLGTVSANATTPVAGYINILSNYNAIGIRIGVSNTHSASLVLSNLVYTVY